MIGTLLGGKVRLFVPSCAMRELRDMAKQDKAYSAAVALARKFLRHKDACAPTESTHEILLKQVGSKPRHIVFQSELLEDDWLGENALT